MPENASTPNTVSVPEAAERLGVTPETVRRQIREGQLWASRASGGARAAWRISEAEIERRLSVQQHDERMRKFRDAGGVVGYGDFPSKVDESNNSPEVKQQLHAIYQRRNLFDRLDQEHEPEDEFKAR